MKNVIPCENCIVFAICYTKFKTFKKNNIESIICFTIDYLNCSIVREFEVNATQDDINDLRQFYGLEPI